MGLEGTLPQAEAECLSWEDCKEELNMDKEGKAVGSKPATASQARTWVWGQWKPLKSLSRGVT